MASVIILTLAFLYFGFQLCRAVITGNVEFFRGRVSTRKNNPAQYWTFVAVMGTVCAVCVLFVLI